MRVSSLTYSVSFLLTIGLLLGGCATGKTGEEFDASNRTNLEKGMTPQQVVQVMEQEPLSVNTSSGKVSSYSYQVAKSTTKTNPATFIPVVGYFLGGAETDTDSEYLTIHFNDDERVERWNYRTR